ncbi:MAG: class II glutamine amidotransferase [Thermoplasmata archaeon]|nr:class II glutamine amidotransferase [Thermoplasmata archaeon]MCI4341539.1 class II glutamine amidotransferase [Thermoplasmata archaeon]
MCRLFGLLGSRGSSATPWLTDTHESLLAQSNARPDQLQSDGWGLAWYEKTRTPHVEKGVRGAFDPEESDRFRSAAQRARGPVVVGHLRKASNPMHLPHSMLIAMENVQPFSHGSYLFAHNGEISLPRETRPRLGKFESNLKGVNDSEVLFWLFAKHVEAAGDPLAAYGRARTELQEVWEVAEPRVDRPYSGLNFLFSRGPNELWAFCSSLGDHGSSLTDPNRPYYEMAYRTDTRELIVGSEPFDRSLTDWRTLSNGQYLVGRADHGLVGIETGPLP